MQTFPVFTLWFFSWICALLPYGAWLAYRRLKAEGPLPSPRSRFAGGIVTLLITGLLAWFTALRHGVHLSLRFDAESSGLAFAVFVGLIAGASRALRKPDRLASSRRLFGTSNPNELAWALLLGLCAGTIEEFAYRGVLYSLLERWTGTLSAFVLASLIFAAAHLAQGPRNSAKIFGLGVIFQILFIMSGSLLAPMLLHASYDTVVLAMLYKRHDATAASLNTLSQSA